MLNLGRKCVSQSVSFSLKPTLLCTGTHLTTGRCQLCYPAKCNSPLWSSTSLGEKLNSQSSNNSICVVLRDRVRAMNCTTKLLHPSPKIFLEKVRDTKHDFPVPMNIFWTSKFLCTFSTTSKENLEIPNSLCSLSKISSQSC